MPLALASAVPVKTDQGEASPQPLMPASVLILTMTPGIDCSMSPTPCRRFILSGQRTTSTATPVIRSLFMTTSMVQGDNATLRDFNSSLAIRKIGLCTRAACNRRDGEHGGSGRKEEGSRGRRRHRRGHDGELFAAQGPRGRAA